MGHKHPIYRITVLPGKLKRLELVRAKGLERVMVRVVESEVLAKSVLGFLLAVQGYLDGEFSTKLRKSKVPTVS